MSTGLNLIKELREKTGVGFLDCKVALKENVSSYSRFYKLYIFL